MIYVMLVSARTRTSIRVKRVLKSLHFKQMAVEFVE